MRWPGLSRTTDRPGEASWVMATPSHSETQSRPPPADDRTPTTLADWPPPPTATAQTTGNIVQDERRSEEIGETAGRPRKERCPSLRADRAEPVWLPHGEEEEKDVNHAHSTPIPVPVSQPLSAMGFTQTLSNGSFAGDYPRYDERHLDEYVKSRRPSISFHPTVTLETGHQRPLNEPLPKLIIDTHSTRESLQEEARFPTHFSLYRAQSEADCRNYDQATGEPLDIVRRSDPTAPSLHETISPLRALNSSQSTVLEVPEHRTSSESEQGQSLTSGSSTSPLVSEAQTPTDAMEILMSPISTFSSLTFPLSLEDSSAWPKPRRRTSGPRAKSYEVERGFSMRSAQRQISRTNTRRSTSSSTMSPATAFLSRFSRQDSVIQEPDSEGQEVGEYVLGKQVGFGGFSTVREAYTLEGDERICRAVKIVRKQIPGKQETENEQLQAEFEHEVSLWRCLGHRNILPLIEVYETNFATFCFTKLNTGGTLFDVVRANRQGIGRDLARRYAYQLASAIRYLHEDVRVVHRDIKLENCLVDVSDPDAAKDGGNVLLCDFGLAEFVTHDLVRSHSPETYDGLTDRSTPLPSDLVNLSDSATSIAGSLQYASPELISSPAGFLSSVVDVWAYGVVMYALLVGDLPFQHTFQPRVQTMILAGEWDATALEKAPGVVGFEEEALEMIRGCLDMDSHRRWTISQVLGCQWLSGCQEILEELNADFKL